MSDDLVKRLKNPRPMSMFLTRADQAEDWAGQMKAAADRIEELEAKQQETFQMYVDANEARIDAEAENTTLKQMWWDAGDVTDLAGTIADLEAKLAKAMVALKFYADEENYKGQSYLEKCGCCSSWYEPKIYIDGEDSGDLARTTLAALKGQGDE